MSLTRASEYMPAFRAWGDGRSLGALEGRIMPLPACAEQAHVVK